MRSVKPMRMTRRGRLVAGALMSAIPAAIPVGQALASTSVAPTVPATIHDHAIAFNHPVVVSGALSSADAGHRLQLQFQATGASTWQGLAHTTVGPRGGYRVSAPLRRSGDVRVVDTTAAGTPLAQAREAGSAAQRVAVAASMRVTPRAHGALTGGRMSLGGQLLPEQPGRLVKLQSANGSHWTTIATTRTGRHGGFMLRFAAAPGTHRLRVRFSGDRLNTASAAGAGSVTGFEQNVASWYDDAGQTGCGFHATYGVANKSLPCGTKVTFSYAGHTVVATVDDRGPYVGGRTWDLNQNTAAALGFVGVGTVWDSY